MKPRCSTTLSWIEAGEAMLAEMRVSLEAVEIIRLTTPPPYADYFRNFQAIGVPECAVYLDYVRALAVSGNQPAIEMKLADITNTIDACRTGGTPVQATQYWGRYEPSRRILEGALSPLV